MIDQLNEVTLTLLSYEIFELHYRLKRKVKLFSREKRKYSFGNYSFIELTKQLINKKGHKLIQIELRMT